MTEAKDLMKQFVDAINTHEEVQKMLKNWNKVACYDLEGEDGPFHIIHSADGTAEFKEGAPEKANFTFKATADLWAQISKGEKDAQKAFFAKEYKIEGDVMGTMKLIPVMKKINELL
ncbi:MAG: SCP2 sterol-binding domain-containing protein [Candidatus Hodarchaeales archaeon]